MVRKQSRARISPEIEGFILGGAMERPFGDRTVLAESLQKVISKKYGEKPSIETLEKKISFYRNHAGDGPQEKPWDIGTLNEFPLPAEALPAVVICWAHLNIAVGPTLSIRQAKWVARLYPFYKKQYELLLLCAITYASYELSGEILKIPLEWRWETINLYEYASGKQLPTKLRHAIAKAEPITDFRVEDMKKYNPHYFQKPKKQKKAEGAKK